MSIIYLKATLLGMLTFCMVMKSQMLKPVGPKMCDHLCKYRVGCTLYTYSHSALSCLWGRVKNGTHQYRAIKLKKTDKKHAHRNLTCQEGAVIFHTRTNKLLCRSVWVVQQQSCKNLTKIDKSQYRSECSQERGTEQKRLLMLPRYGEKQGRQLFLHNNSVVPCENITYQDPLAVTYVSSAKKLIIATANPNQVVSVSLRQGNSSIIAKGFYILTMTADEEAQNLIYVKGRPKSICMMTPTGKNQKTVSSIKGIPLSISTDTKREMIYVIYGKRTKYIYKYTYNGVYKGKVDSDPKSLYLNQNTDILYYIKGKVSTVYSLSLSNGSVTKMKELGITGQALYVIDNTIYVFHGTSELTAFPEEGEKFNINTTLEGLESIVCLIR